MMDDIYVNWVGPGLLSFPLNLNTPDFIIDRHDAEKTRLLENHDDYYIATVDDPGRPKVLRSGNEN